MSKPLRRDTMICLRYQFYTHILILTASWVNCWKEFEEPINHYWLSHLTERDREALSRPVLKLYPKRKDTHLGRNDSKPIIIIFIFKSPWFVSVVLWRFFCIFHSWPLCQMTFSHFRTFPFSSSFWSHTSLYPTL